MKFREYVSLTNSFSSRPFGTDMNINDIMLIYIARLFSEQSFPLLHKVRQVPRFLISLGISPTTFRHLLDEPPCSCNLLRISSVNRLRDYLVYHLPPRSRSHLWNSAEGCVAVCLPKVKLLK